jgi:alpha-beta hydrolase superfamily lysophospholipase
VYDGFRRFDLDTSDAGVALHGVVGGSGPPLLLLHGNPLTHIHWRLIAPRLAERFTIVATDLRGYGDSGKPRGLPDHSNYSFRRMAQDTFRAWPSRSRTVMALPSTAVMVPRTRVGTWACAAVLVSPTSRPTSSAARRRDIRPSRRPAA